MPEYKLHYMQRMSQRKFTDEQVQVVLNNPDSKIAQRAGGEGGTVYKMQKKVDGKNLVVVAEINKNEVYLITAYFKDE